MLFHKTLLHLLRAKVPYSEETERFEGFTSPHVPKVAAFLEFWETTIVEDAYAQDEELEVDELQTMFKIWAKARGAPGSIEARSGIVKQVFSGKDGAVIHIPVSFSHLLNNVQGQLLIGADSLVDVTPLECFNMVDEAYADLESIVAAPPTELFKTAFYFHLSPMNLLMTKRFNKVAIHRTCSTGTMLRLRSPGSGSNSVGRPD